MWIFIVQASLALGLPFFSCPAVAVCATCGGRAAAGARRRPQAGNSSAAAAPTAFAAPKPNLKLDWGAGRDKSYWIPAAEILSSDFALNQFNRNCIDRFPYGVHQFTKAEVQNETCAAWYVQQLLGSAGVPPRLTQAECG